MTAQATPGSRKPGPPTTPTVIVLTPEETARRLKVSLSWLAKGRMSGRGPRFIKVGRAVRYTEPWLEEWIKKHEPRARCRSGGE